MRVSGWVGLCVVVLTTGTLCSAQQKFPQRPGEWAMTSPEMGSKPMLFCLNDDEWQKALTQNKVCTIHDLNVSSSGVSYSVDCPGKSFQMKGRVTMTFDGKEHMIGTGQIDSLMNGKTTTTQTHQDFRWKNPECSPNDLNLRADRAK